MKKITRKGFGNLSALLFSFEFVLVEVILVVLAVSAFFTFNLDKYVQADTYQYALGTSVGGHVVDVSISPATVSPDLVLIIKNVDTGAVAYDSKGLGSGVTNREFSLTGAGNYEAHLVWFLSDVAAPVRFVIEEDSLPPPPPPPSPWTLNNPIVNGGDMTVTFSPASNGNVGVWIKNSAGNLVKDSGAIPNGQSSYSFSDMPAGNYTVALAFGFSELTPYKSFRVDRKAVLQKTEMRCGTSGYPRNVIAKHYWKPASGVFSNQTLQISTTQNFTTNVQEKSINNSTSSFEVSGYESLKGYYWRIRSVTNDGRAIFSRVQGFTTIDCPNSVPTIPIATGVSGLPACVAAGAKYGDTLTFNWGAVSPVTSYTVRLTFDHATHGDYSTKTATTNSATGTGGWSSGGNPNVTWVNNGNLAMSAGVTYYFAVQATNNGQNSGWDLANKSFKVGPVPTCATTDPDTDGDGFKDSVEDYIGTDKKIACGTGAWPPDFNDDKVINSLDQMLLAKNLAAKGSVSYNKRYDLNKDTVVNIGDQALLASKFGQSCKVLGVKTNLSQGQVQGATTPSRLRVGYVCSESPTAAYVAWDGVGDYWVDYSWDNWATYVHKYVTNAWVTGIPGGYTTQTGAAADYYVLFPGRTYKWRLWNGTNHFNGPDFTVPTCSGGVGTEKSEVHDYVYGVASNIYTDLPVGNGLGNKTLARAELGRFLWGLAGCESRWNANNDSNLTYKGLYQYLPSTWTNVLREMGEPTTTSIFDGFAQTRGVIHNIEVSKVEDPWDAVTGRLTMFNTQWGNCSFIWNFSEYQAGY